MTDTNSILVLAALLKWRASEPLSPGDADRILTMLETSNFIVSAEPQTAAAFQVRIRHLLNTKFGGNQPK